MQEKYIFITENLHTNATEIDCLTSDEWITYAEDAHGCNIVEYDMQALIDCYGEDDLPDTEVEIIKRNGSVFEVTVGSKSAVLDPTKLGKDEIMYEARDLICQGQHLSIRILTIKDCQDILDGTDQGYLSKYKVKLQKYFAENDDLLTAE